MTDMDVITLAREMILTALMLALPLLGVGLLIGLTVSLFQAVTQVNEMTLTFVPKMAGVAISLAFFLPWIIRVLTRYTENLINSFSSILQ